VSVLTVTVIVVEGAGFVTSTVKETCWPPTISALAVVIVSTLEFCEADNVVAPNPGPATNPAPVLIAVNSGRPTVIVVKAAESVKEMVNFVGTSPTVVASVAVNDPMAP
jgi:hypothetical protein